MFKQLEKSDLVIETVGGEPYEYYPLGTHIVRAPGVCGGRPTFKYTRIEVDMVMVLLKEGRTPEQIVEGYRKRISIAAVLEAIDLATQSFLEMQPVLPLAA